MSDEYYVQEINSKEYARILLLSVSSESYKNKNLSKVFLPEPLISPPSERDVKLVSDVCQYLLENLAGSTTLQALSSKFGTNRNKLACTFKSIHSCGVFGWLRIQRLEKARELLLTSDLSILNISILVGYDSAANFSTAYKSFYLTTPINHRKENY